MQEDADAGKTPGGLWKRKPGGLRKDAERTPGEDAGRTPGGRQKRSPEGLLREYLLSPGGGASLDVCERYPSRLPGVPGPVPMN